MDLRDNRGHEATGASKQDIIARIGSSPCAALMVDQGSIRCIKIPISEFGGPETEDHVTASDQRSLIVTSYLVEQSALE